MKGLILTIFACIMFSGVKILWRTGNLLRIDELKHSNQEHRMDEFVHSSNQDQGGRNKIPRIVHQTYKTTDLPPNFKSWRDTCIARNPEWEFKIWTDDDNLQLVKEYYPSMLDLYQSYNINIKRIDMVRYLYLHKFGGVYMDMDITCLQPFGTMLDEHYGKFIIANQYASNRTIVEGALANAFMASSPGLELFDDIFHELPLRKELNVLLATGGKFLKRFILYKPANKGKWIGLPFELIYAQEWTNNDLCDSIERCQMQFPEAITVSFWTHTWLGANAQDHKWQ